ncbi:MAG: DUF3179 domain-containing protein [Euryarchaeota archaeon]|nr:DUF3179 domain-containing protein [Euryarchaeota archaeon]
MTWIRASSAFAAACLVALSATIYIRAGDPDQVHDVLPRGAIPALFPADDEFRAVDEASTELVLGVEMGGEAHAYPIGLLNFHEIVNDEVGGVPVAATWCPLCATGIVFDRRVAEQTLTFVVSGKLLRNNLVMSDEETRSLWPQLTGEAIEGPLKGHTLTVLPSVVLPWSSFRELHPNATVLAPAGEIPAYSDPYAGYDQREGALFPIGHHDRALFTKDLVYGLSVNGEHRAYPVRTIAERQVFQDRLGSVNITVTYWSGAASFFTTGNRTFTILDAARMQEANGAVWHRATGQRQVGTDWTDERLDRLVAVPSYWFAWKDFHPDTTIYGATPKPGAGVWNRVFIPNDYFTLLATVAGLAALAFPVRAAMQRLRSFTPGPWRSLPVWPGVVAAILGSGFVWAATGADTAYAAAFLLPAVGLIVAGVLRIWEARALGAYQASFGPWHSRRARAALASLGAGPVVPAKGWVGPRRMIGLVHAASGQEFLVTWGALLRRREEPGSVDQARVDPSPSPTAAPGPT